MSQTKHAKKISTLKTWPASERPRERLFERGAASLSDAELLCLFLRSGRVGENVKDLAVRLLQSSGSLRELARRPMAELLEVPGMGPAKVSTLAAAFEIGNRLMAERVQNRKLVESARDVFDFLSHYFSQKREEHFVGVLLNVKNEITKTVLFAQGDPDRIVVSVSQVMRRLVMEGCVGVIFAHGHPSGDPQPSKEDISFTKKLLRACQAVEIMMHDHVIFGEKGFVSLAQEGLL